MFFASIETWASGFVPGVDSGYVIGGIWVSGLLFTAPDIYVDRSTLAIVKPAKWVLAPPFADRVGWQQQPPAGFGIAKGLLVQKPTTFFHGADPIKDLTKLVIPSISNKTVGICPGGVGLSFAAGSHITYPDGVFGGNVDQTRLAVVYQTSQGDFQLISNVADSLGMQWGWRTAAVNKQFVQPSNTGYGLVQGTSILSLNKIQTLGFTYRSSDNEVRFYLDGKADGSGSAVAPGGGAAPILGARFTDTSGAFLGIILLHVTWLECSSPALMLSLTANPWQLFSADY